MPKYKTAHPSQHVRLRDWDSGRLSQLRLAVQRLETEVNKTLPASTLQSDRRKVSGQVPFILDLSVKPGYRQASVHFSPPPGLGGHPRRQLLFYEIQHADTAAFADPTTIRTSQTDVSIAGLDLGASRSFRARVVSTWREVSKWCTPVTVVLARSKIQQTSMDDFSVRLTADVGEWQEVASKVFQPVDSKISANVHIGVACPHFDVRKKRSGIVCETYYGGPASVQFRWKIGVYNGFTGDYDYTYKGPRMLLSARPGYTTSSDRNAVRTPTAFGNFILPFMDSTSGINARVVLEACKTPGSEWKGHTAGRTMEISDPMIFTRRGQIIEVVQGF